MMAPSATCPYHLFLMTSIAAMHNVARAAKPIPAKRYVCEVPSFFIPTIVSE